MRVISPKRLRQFWTKHRQAEAPLRAWLRRTERADWESFHDVRRDFGSADHVGRFVVFNVGGNKYRLIAEIIYQRHQVLVRHILTHDEYDDDDWKND